MRSFKQNTPIKRRCSAVALGFFDGVHIGHRAVITAAANCADDGLVPVVYTFDKSPKACVSGVERGLLSSERDKSRIMEDLGVKRLYAVDFNEIRFMSPCEFVSAILCETLRASRVFCGFNYRFGINGSGDAETLTNECLKYGIGVTVVPPVFAGDAVVSSTEIRAALQSGDIRRANAMLGRRFSYSGRIIRGRQLGRRLGTPTINQKLPQGITVPKFGVYASLVHIVGNAYRGVTNIGVKPTVGSSCILSETWLIDYSGEPLYGRNSTVELAEFLRPEQKFTSVDELKNAILNDGKRVASMNIQR